MKKLISIILLATLVGCSSVPNNFNTLSAEQLKAINSDKNITVICNSVSTMVTDVTNIYVVMDKSVITNGLISVNGRECTFKVTTEK